MLFESYTKNVELCRKFSVTSNLSNLSDENTRRGVHVGKDEHFF